MKRGVYEFQGPPAEVVARLEKARAEDLQAEKKGLALKLWTTLFFLLMVVALFGTDYFEFSSLFVLVFLVAGVVSLVKAFRTRAHNLEDAPLLAALRLVRMARADLAPDRPVRLKVDFRDYPAREFQISQEGGFTKEKRTVYRQPWLEFQGRLADGARLQLEVLRKARRLDYWSTSTSGKYRRRSKDTVLDVITLSLQVPGLDLSDLAASLSPGPPAGLVGKQFEVQGDTVRIQVLTPRARRSSGSRLHNLSLQPGDLAHGDRLLALLLWLYQGLGRLRAGKAPAARPEAG